MTIAAVLGKETLVAVKPETSGSEGTAVACGAGNQIDVLEGLSIEAITKNQVDEDTLAPVLKSTWKEPEQSKITIPVAPKYQTLEPLFGVTLGSETAPEAQTNPLAYANEFKEATISRAVTIPVAKGDDKAEANILEISEICGAKVAEYSLDQGDLGRAKEEFVVIGKDTSYASTTNTAATMAAVTLGDASYPTNLLTFDHLKRGGVYLAAQDSDAFGASQKVAVKGLKIGIKTGLLDSIDDNYSTSGREVPIQAGKNMVSVGCTLFRDSTAAKVMYDKIRNGEKMKMKVHYKSDRGIPGCSISAGSPSTDISGGSDTNLKIRITHVLTNTTEDVQITLTLDGLNSGALIAAAIQTAFRAATATGSLFQNFLDTCICTYNSQVSAKYYLSAATSTLYNVAVIAATEKDLKEELKLGTAQSGTEPTYEAYQRIYYIPEIIFSDPGDEFSLGAKPVELEGFAMASYTTTPYGFNTAEDTYLQSNMSGEQIRIVEVNRLATSPYA